MSRKSQLEAAIVAVMDSMGGSHLTREARRRTAARFAGLMFQAGYTHLAGPADITGKQIRAYVAARQQTNLKVRTLQNELAHLRAVLRTVGKQAVAAAKELSNANLGVGGGSRLGSKTALSVGDFNAACAVAVQQKRPGMAALLGLERRLGLRGNEAIHGRPDTLRRWLQELEAGDTINVIAGTKGGRRRAVKIFAKAEAAEVIRHALELAENQGGFLVVRKNGQPAGGLKQARSIYHAWANRAGIQPHAARYAFARGQLDAYLKQGYSSREALMAVSHDLGHGDGRGRWVKSVYMK